MKNKLKLALCAAAVASSTLFGLWYWQANHAYRLRSINVPKWVAGGKNVSYSIAVHKSQINPYGTIWKQTTYKRVIPRCNDLTKQPLSDSDAGRKGNRE